MEDVIDPDIVENTDFRVALAAGGAAGTSVDIILFPLDTIKTRLQSERGFWKSGGFRGIYSGLFSAAVGSAPTAALFFVAYESTKTTFNNITQDRRYQSFGHMMAASIGEVSACLIRVPVEVVKQRTQALGTGSSIASFKKTLNSEGLGGFYRGYFSTVLREVPFSIIQFPLWEYLKSRVSKHTEQPITALQSSLCGATSGAISAAITTPLDVVKTRVMLAEKGSSIAKGSISFVVQTIIKEKGFMGLYAGIAPRVMWISIGGSVFLGVYEKVKITLTQMFKV
ncbi:S-adenosylmethionine mitochondrial carrier protein-like [Aplysia californica]|uniref:S-adenosylmethionine mitochondrial carrier protein-like n=1 Tax=Aplysia californica TaxID=6500 RepID=A0ABM0JGK7_APLCA|nr:S-adenosylmethionine mitochondrial carrier protein-like [Aplysia californica]